MSSPARLLLLSFLTACSSPALSVDASVPGADASQPAVDASVPDSGIALAADASVPGADASQPAVDAGADQPLTAVVGSRCEYYQRRAVLTVSDDGSANRYLSAFFQDVPDPWVGMPELTDSSCKFHLAWSGTCDGKPECDGARVCSHTGTCVAAPVPATSLSVTVRGTSGTQQFDSKPGDSFGGSITVADPALALTIVADGLRIEVPEMSAPASLTNPQGTLTGSWDQPEAIDLSWTAPASPAQVYSLTRINHHAATSTFTECVVAATAGKLHIDRAMLEPLAVITGLEFQSVQHVRFAAVETATGCVEVRFQRDQYFNLTN
ncbi:MAG: hypothetical protein QM765_33195 [Myxococcales bacterium]